MGAMFDDAETAVRALMALCSKDPVPTSLLGWELAGLLEIRPFMQVS
jgi:hypothetical protein